MLERGCFASVGAIQQFIKTYSNDIIVDVIVENFRRFFAEIISLRNGLLWFPCFVLEITESHWFDASKSLLNKPVNSYKIVSQNSFSSALQSSIGPVIANNFKNQFTFRPIRTRIVTVTKLMNELYSVAKEVRYYRCVLIGQKPTFCCAGKLVLKSRKDHSSYDEFKEKIGLDHVMG